MGKVVEKEVNADELKGSNPVEFEKMDNFIDISKKEDKKKGMWYCKKRQDHHLPFLRH